MENIFKEFMDERVRQDEKFGEQNIPCLDQTLLNRENSCTAERMCEEYEIPTESRAKQLCETAMQLDSITYAHIASEEFSEVVSALDPVTRRKELIQLGAVVLGWIEKIDRLGESENLDVSQKADWIRQVQILAVTNKMCQRHDGTPITISDAQQLFTLETMFEYFVDNIPPSEALTLRIIEFNEQNDSN